jgi:replicative DNA helicase
MDQNELFDENLYLIELEIVFSLVKHKNFMQKVIFLSGEDFVYLGKAFEYVKNHNQEPEASLLSDLVQLGLVKADDIALYDEITPDEKGLNLTIKYANWVKEKSVLRRISPQLKELSIKKFLSTSEVYAKIKEIQEEISKSGIKNVDILSVEDISREFFNELNRKDIYRFGFRFGNMNLDDYIYDFVPGNVVVIGARPGIGKTLLSLHIAYKHALENIPVHLISMEMTKFQIFGRLVSMISKIPASKIFKKELTEEEKKLAQLAVEKMNSWPLYFSSTHDGSLENIESIIRRSVYENGTKIVFIDYLQLMSNIKFSGNRHLEIGSIAQRLKTLAIELDVAIVEISQLSRKLNEEPNIDDLKESGDIEQAASLIALMSNKKEEEIDSITLNNGEKIISTRKYINFYVKKQRNGPLFTAVISYDTKTFDFNVEEIKFGSTKKTDDKKGKS